MTIPEQLVPITRREERTGTVENVWYEWFTEIDTSLAALATVPAAVTALQAADVALDARLDAVEASFVLEDGIIGGDFGTNLWQRGTSIVSPASGAYTADRFWFANTGGGLVTISKSADAPTVAQVGRYVSHCMLVDVTTADAAIAAGDFVAVGTSMEGLFWRQFAQFECTLRFWHKHTKTGTYSISLRNSGVDRSLVMEYTQAVSDVWEEAVITIPASPSAGTWVYESTGTGVHIDWALCAGSNFTQAAGAWQAANKRASPNQVNAMDNTANNFRLACISFSRGPERPRVRDPLQERALQRRYLRRWTTDGGNNAYLCSGIANSTTQAQVPLAAIAHGMRGVPTYGYSGGNIALYIGTGGINVTSIGVSPYEDAPLLVANVAAGLTAGQAVIFYCQVSSYFELISEL